MSDPSRTCVGCRESAAPGQLTRWVLESGSPRPDLERHRSGRGAWLHPALGCLRKASPGFSRSFRRAVSVTEDALLRRLAEAAGARAARLLTLGKRHGSVVEGERAVTEALREGRARLVVVTRQNAGQLPAPVLDEAVAQGKVSVIGGLTSGDWAQPMVVVEERSARAIQEALRIFHMSLPVQQVLHSGVGPVSEVE